MKLFYFEKRLFGTSLYLLLKDQTYEKGQNSLGHMPVMRCILVLFVLDFVNVHLCE